MTLELIVGGRSLGRFTRGELVEINAQICCVLEVDVKLASAWLSLRPEQKERINRIVGAVCNYFEAAFVLAGKGGCEQRFAAALIREFAPDVPIEAVAAVLRIQVPCVEAHARSVGKMERGGRPAIKREMDRLRAMIARAVKAMPGNATETTLQR